MLKISERREQIEAPISCLFQHGARQFLVQGTLPFIKYLKGTSPDHVNLIVAMIENASSGKQRTGEAGGRHQAVSLRD